jgi:alcohol dehydrogenase class IV
MFMGHNLFPQGPGLLPPPLTVVVARCPKKRAFVVTDEFANRFAKEVVKALVDQGFTTETWDGVLPEPPIDSIRSCTEAMTAFEPDLIVAVGGGSVIDSAKAAWIVYEHPEFADLFNLSPLVPLTMRQKALLMAVPTTSGTGSEVTGASVVTDPEARRKVPLMSPQLIPDFAFLVPEFTKSMPPRLTVGTGLDALAHAWDCVCHPASNDITDALALAAIEMIFQWLPRAYNDGADIEARLKMMTAASVAGLAFGQGGIALTHSCGHSLGGLFGIHHGLTVGVFVPYATRFYRPVSKRWLKICKTLDVDGDSDDERMDNLMDKLRRFYRELDAPWCIGDMDVSQDQFEDNLDKLVEYTMDDIQTAVSPRPITRDQCEKFFRYAYEGKDIDF